MKKKFVTLLLLICGMAACSQVAFAADGSASVPVDLGQVLPIWSCIPFIGLLLCIAICPLIKPEWWEKNQPIVIIFWSLLFLIPFGIAYGSHVAIEHLLEVLIGDYLTFIILLFGLFCVAGNIVLEGDLVGTPKVNLVMLLIGALLSSWVGTTGASMIMIRPLIRANQWRSHKVHVMVFFIFLVSNIGGCLTPVGDPPLLMGFMHGVPFFWTLRLAPVFLLNAAILLIVFFIIDHRDYKKDLFMGRTPVASENKKPLHLAGAHNIIFLVIIVGAVILSGTLPSMELFQTADGAVRGILLYGDVTLTYPALIEVVIILVAAFLSFKTTKKKVRTENHFSWGAIQEVAVLFVGIFITMIPALLILKAKGAGLGLDQPYQMFWITGLLSSFLDNTPTYLVFLTTAGTLGATAGVATNVGIIPTVMLEAISCGAIFMGANTYIGNAPNFMVRSIAEENGIKMPSFFGYIFWSLRYLIPIFVLDMLIFFL